MFLTLAWDSETMMGQVKLHYKSVLQKDILQSQTKMK